jgi:hypothetical protein
VSSYVAPPDIKLTELNSILRVIEKHFRKANNVEKIYHNMGLKVIEKQYEKINIVWGLCDRKSNNINGYEINVIVGYN